MAATIGSYYLAKFNQGKGILLSKILDRQYGKVLIIGDGVVGRHAAKASAARAPFVVTDDMVRDMQDGDVVNVLLQHRRDGSVRPDEFAFEYLAGQSSASELAESGE